MAHFQYHSEQVHSTFENGKGSTRRNIVDIKNGKGTKAVEHYSVDGKQLSRKEKQLTDKEMECIQKGHFVPGLFKDCVRPLNSSKTRKVKKGTRRGSK
jgi:hypothetical protein